MAGLFLLWRTGDSRGQVSLPGDASPSLANGNDGVSGKIFAASTFRSRRQGKREAGEGGSNDVTPVQAEWEKKVDAVLLADLDNSVKGTRLMSMLPQLTEEARVEVAQEAVNLLPDSDYGPASALLTNAQTSAAVLTVLMQDVLQRGNELKLPLFLQMARTEGHPLRDEAHGILETYLKFDYGTDWPKWERMLTAWLRDSGTFQPPE